MNKHCNLLRSKSVLNQANHDGKRGLIDPAFEVVAYLKRAL